MSLQARTLDKENAGVVSRGNKPGEAPSKQAGPTKRKGLSEMGSNQLAAPRSLGGGLKTQVRAGFLILTFISIFHPLQRHLTAHTDLNM